MGQRGGLGSSGEFRGASCEFACTKYSQPHDMIARALSPPPNTFRLGKGARYTQLRHTRRQQAPTWCCKSKKNSTQFVVVVVLLSHSVTRTRERRGSGGQLISRRATSSLYSVVVFFARSSLGGGGGRRAKPRDGVVAKATPLSGAREQLQHEVQLRLRRPAPLFMRSAAGARTSVASRRRQERQDEEE